MNLVYEGSKFMNFKNELTNLIIPEIKVHFIEDSVYSGLPGNYVYIYSFHAAPTKEGFGTYAMLKIIEIANRHKIILFLFPYGTSSYFYSKLNFIEAAEKYKGYFEPLKLFKFYDGFENEFNNFLKNQKPLKKILNSLKKQFVKSKKIVAVDLFCGIGGLTYGLEKSKIKVIAGIDLDKSCKFAYEKNNNTEFIHKDITRITGNDIIPFYNNSDIKILVGCTPCQPFSQYQKEKSDRKKHKDWGLLYEFLRLIKEIKPDIISMENVPNLLKEEVFKDFIKGLKEEKYFITYRIQNAYDCGVPQNRNRLILLASKLGSIDFIEKGYEKINLKKAIGNLEAITAGIKNNPKDFIHVSSKLTEINMKRIKKSIPGGTWDNWPEKLLPNCYKKESGKTYKSVYGRMDWDKPSPTLTTQFYNYGTGRYGHPEQNRAISLREGAIIQSFPLEYIFTENTNYKFTEIARQIGNAVPPKLGEFIGESIIKHLKDMGVY